MQLWDPACQRWQVIHTRYSWWTPLCCQDGQGILGLTLPEHLELDLWSSVHHAYFWHDLAHMDHSNTWYPSPYLTSWGSKTFTVAPTPTTAFTPYLSDQLNLHSFFEPKMQNILLLSPLCTPARALKIYCFLKNSFSEYGDFLNVDFALVT